MADAKTTTWPHQDLLNDNKINVADLPQKVQDKITKFALLTDKDAQEAMDESLYGAIDDFLEDKAKKEKSEKTKQKVADHKKKKEGIDVSGAATAKSAEDLSKEEEERKKKEGETKPKTMMDRIYGRK
jgi:hypothetical protein